MRIVFVVERATQFEAPFFRFAAADPRHRFEVLFTDPRPGGDVQDPELGRAVDWGFDRLAGYPSQVLPAEPRARAAFLARFFAADPAPDLVIVNGYAWAAYRAVNRAARKAGRRTALRIDSTAWGERAARRLGKRWILAPWLRRRFDIFLPVGTAARQHLRRLGIPEARIGRFPYAVDHDRFRAARSIGEPERRALRHRFGLAPAGHVLLAVSKLAERETPWDLARLGGLLAAADRPGALVEPPQFLVVGDGPQRGAFEATARAFWNDRAVFAGYVPYARLVDAYAAADVFAHTPQEERWGVSVAEALAAGLPVVTSDRVGAAIDLLAPGENGSVYRAGDLEAAARAVRAAFGLQRAAVAAASDQILDRWGYAATWADLLSAGAASPNSGRRSKGRRGIP